MSGLSAQKMLAELASPVVDEEREPVAQAFAEAVDSLLQLAYSAQLTPGSGPTWASLSVLTRGISDLLAGGHLVEHRYLPQAYSTMRPVYDACDLLGLFEKDRAEATRWIETEEGHRDFAPKAVRKRLGVAAHDPMHSHFSESGSHPRFAGAKLNSLMRVAVEDPGDRTAVIRAGPTWKEHPASLHTWLFAFDALVKLGFAARTLVVITQIERPAWLRAYRDCVAASIRGQSTAYDLLGEPGESIDVLKTLLQHLDEWT